MDFNCHLTRDTSSLLYSYSCTTSVSHVTDVSPCGPNHSICIWQWDLHMLCHLPLHSPPLIWVCPTICSPLWCSFKIQCNWDFQMIHGIMVNIGDHSNSFDMFATESLYTWSDHRTSSVTLQSWRRERMSHYHSSTVLWTGYLEHPIQQLCKKLFKIITVGREGSEPELWQGWGEGQQQRSCWDHGHTWTHHGDGADADDPAAVVDGVVTDQLLVGGSKLCHWYLHSWVPAVAADAAFLYCWAAKLMVHFVVVDLSWLAAQNWHYQDPTSHTIPTRGCQHNAV